MDGARGKVVRVAAPGLTGAAEFTERQYRVISLFDGKRSLPEVARAARARLGWDPSPTELLTLVARLRSLHFLVEEMRDAHQATPGGVGPTAEALDWFGTSTLEEPEEQTDVGGGPIPAPGSEHGGEDQDGDDQNTDGAEDILTADDPTQVVASPDEQMLPLPDDAEITEEGERPVDVEAAESASEDERAIEEAARTKRRRRRWRALLVLVALGAIVATLAVIPFDLWVNERCVLVPSSRVVVRSKLSGQIRYVHVKEGDEIRKGELVVALDDHGYRADLENTEAKMRRAMSELKRLRHGARREELAQARQAVATKATEVHFAVKQAERLSKLARQNLVTKEKLDAAEREVAVRRREYAEAQAALTLLRAGSRSETIEATEAEIEHYKVELRFKRAQLDLSRIYAPISGRVVTPRMDEKVNTHVRTGDPVVEVVDSAVMRADIFVPERELDAVRPGLGVEVKVTAYPERSFWGRVLAVGQKVERGELVNTVRVSSDIQNAGRLLKPGMTGHAKIYAGRRSILYLITRRIIRWVRVELVI
ncbi:MAG: HlyD family efflux transporter periplasmic adaptor subunit [Deltaproteobacteria bacterium]|nr:HlyD family efflux transporter periplasmic adaptor subunit [Deltaproteobacteria bacterium]